MKYWPGIGLVPETPAEVDTYVIDLKSKIGAQEGKFDILAARVVTLQQRVDLDEEDLEVVASIQAKIARGREIVSELNSLVAEMLTLRALL
jgi:hypothetical protein